LLYEYEMEGKDVEKLQKSGLCKLWRGSCAANTGRKKAQRRNKHDDPYKVTKKVKSSSFSLQSEMIISAVPCNAQLTFPLTY